MSSLSLGSNIASLLAQRRLNQSSDSIAATFERLSSGLRINRASDDAAGLAIANSLQSDARVYTQAIRNVNDGISLLNIADSALESLTTITNRLQELAAQAANGALSVTQRGSLDTEAQALSDEYFRIAQSTTFNGKNLFTADFGQLTLQAGYGSDGNLSSTLGGAIGTAEFGTGIDTTTSATLKTYGDVNGDGNLDVITLATSYVEVFLGTGNGSFSSALSISNSDSAIYDIAVGDVNGDGNLDIITAGNASATNNLRVRLGNGDGTFGADTSYLASGAGGELALADVNGDGYDDVAFSTSNGLAGVHLAQSDGSLAAPISTVTTLFSDPYSVSLEDLDNDGVLDLVTMGYAPGGAPIRVALGNGDGTFQASTSLGNASETYIGLVGDVDGDGYLDIIHNSDYGGVFLRRGNGDGTFAAAEQIVSGTSANIELGDANGDGLLDLFVSDFGSSSVVVYTGNGDGSFTFASTISDVEYDTYADDFNNDGVIDILGRNGTGTNFSVALGETTSGVGPLLPFSLKSIADAREALSRFGQKLDQLTTQRGTVGAFMSRTDFASSHLQSLADNSQAAASRITDADIASETANLVRLQILQQASVAVLAQANLQPQLVLSLLKGPDK